MAHDQIVQEETPASIENRRMERTAKRIIETASPPAPTETISERELTKLLDLRRTISEGQQRIAQTTEIILKATGAFEFLMRELQERYDLTEQEMVDETGVIHRVSRVEK